MKSAVPTCYFSLRSPYSWLAWHDLKVAYPKLLARVHLVPFWEPDVAYQQVLEAAGEAFLYTAMSKAKHLYILGDVKRLAVRRGLTLSWPPDKAPVWEVPHLAWLYADAHGKGRAFIERVIDARWRFGHDICDPEVVAHIGGDLGLDPEATRSAHLDPAMRDMGLHCLRDCVRNGVFGVPFFSVGRENFWGIDRLPDFISAIAHVASEVPTADVPGDRPNRAFLDHAGGCG